MGANLVGEEQLTLATPIVGGNVLTVPNDANGGVVYVLSGKVQFTLDSSDPALSDGGIAYQGQSIDLAQFPLLGSILRNLRIIPISKPAQIVAWYFD